MEPVTYLDTHVVAWLYAGQTQRFPRQAQSLLRKSTLLISPMVTLELEYLHEIGRLSEGPATVLPFLQASLGLRVCERAFAEVVTRAWSLDWTRDPFDRIITAQASLGANCLLSKDESIAANYPHTVWA